MSTGRHRRVGQRPHHSDMATPVDQSERTPGEQGAGVARSLDKLRIIASRRSAEHAHVPDAAARSAAALVVDQRSSTVSGH
jgi:hypothetical protein